MFLAVPLVFAFVHGRIVKPKLNEISNLGPKWCNLPLDDPPNNRQETAENPERFYSKTQRFYKSASQRSIARAARRR